MTLSGSKTGTNATLWTQVSGPSTIISTPTTLSTTVTGLVGGNTYKFRLSTTCSDGQSTYDEVSVFVSNFPTATAGSNFTICTGDASLKLNGSIPQTNETGSWTIVSGGTGLNIANTSAYNSDITLSPGTGNSGAAVLKWTLTNSISGCTSSANVTITKIAVAAAVNAGNDQTITTCYNTSTSATLAGSSSGGGTYGVWTQVSGPSVANFSNKNSYNSTVSNLVQGVYIFRWTVSGNCYPGFDDVQITVNAPTGPAVSTATASISGTPTMPFCTIPTEIVLLGSSYNPDIETVVWTKSGSGAATIATPNAQNTVVSGFNGVAVDFTYKITSKSSSCSSTSGKVSITFEAGQTLAITTPDPLILACNATSGTINISQTGTTTPQWSIISAPTGANTTNYANISGNSFTPTTFTFPGTYIIRVKKTVGSCTTIYDDINVIASKTPPASNAGSDVSLSCNTLSTSLVGNDPNIPSAVGAIGRWSQVSGSTATITNPLSRTSTITGLTAGKYVFRWTISGGTMCSTTQKDVTVTVATATPIAANAGPDQTICNGTPLYLDGNAPQASDSCLWTVSPSSGVVFSNKNIPNPVVTGLAASTVYTFTYKRFNTCGFSTDNVVVTTSATVGPIAALAGSDQCLSSGITSTTLAGNNPSPGTGLWTKLTGGSATITNPTQFNTTVTGLTDGTYTFEWAITRNACTITRDTMAITISAPATTAAIIGPTEFTACGLSATLQGNTPTVGSGRWTQVSGPGADITSPTSPTTALTRLTDGTYIFRWTISQNGCTTSSADVKINAYASPTTPNAGRDSVLCGATSMAMRANTITSGTGYWNVVSGPNAPTIATNTSPTTTISGLITGEPYVFTWNSRNGLCFAPPDTVKITVIPTANAGLSQTLCGTTTAALTGNASTTGTWTQESPAVTTEVITAVSSSSAVVTNLKPATKYLFKYTLADAQACSAVTDTMTIDVNASPTTSSAGIDKAYCIIGNDTTIQMSANSPTVGTGTWVKRASSPACTIVSPTSPTTNITFGPGTYVLAWNIFNGACTSTDSVIVKISKIIPKSAGTDLSICGVSTNLNAEAATSGIGTWSQVSGPNTASFASKILNTSAVTGLIPGTYIFRWTITDGGCSSSYDDVSVLVSTAPTTPNAGLDRSLCNVTTTDLIGNSIKIGTGLWTKVSGPSCVLTTKNDSTSTVTGMTTGTYVFQWTSSNGSCTPLSDQVTITNLSPLTVPNAGSDFNVCLYTPINLAANTPTQGTGLWSQVSGSPISFTDATSPTTSITGALAGTCKFQWTISNGICSSLHDTVNVNVIEPVETVNAGLDQTVCGTTTTLAGDTPTVGTGIWTQVGGTNATILHPNSPTSEISVPVPGAYTFRWTVTNGICSSLSDDVVITFNQAPTTAYAGPDQLIPNGVTTATMAGNIITIGSGLWTKISGPSGSVITTASSPTTTITNLMTGTYVYRWTSTNGSCTTYDEMTIDKSSSCLKSNKMIQSKLK